MEVLNEAGVLVFQEEAVGAWIWLLLLLPGIFIAGAMHMLVQSKPPASPNPKRAFDPRSRGFSVGVLLLSAVFLPLPWLAQSSYAGLRFEFDEAAGMVRVSDRRSPDVYATPFTGFRGLILTRETESGGDGENSPRVTYELILARVTGPAYGLFRTGDRERVLELANRLSHMLRVTTVTDFKSALAFAQEAPNTSARMPTPFECGAAGTGAGEAPDAFSLSKDVPGLRKIYVSDAEGVSCLLEYPQEPHRMIWPGVLLGIAGLYWAIYVARARGINWKIALGFALALAVTAALGWLALRNFNATGVASFRAPAVAPTTASDAPASVPELRVWTRSPIFGRLGESSLPLRDIRVVQAIISARKSAFYIYDRNPLAFRGLADAFDTARNLRSLELQLGALPVVERLRLADVLATGLAW